MLCTGWLNKTATAVCFHRCRWKQSVKNIWISAQAEAARSWWHRFFNKANVIGLICRTTRVSFGNMLNLIRKRKQNHFHLVVLATARAQRHDRMTRQLWHAWQTRLQHTRTQTISEAQWECERGRGNSKAWCCVPVFLIWDRNTDLHWFTLTLYIAVGLFHLCSCSALRKRRAIIRQRALACWLADMNKKATLISDSKGVCVA